MKQIIASIFLLLLSFPAETVSAATPSQFTLVRGYLIVVSVTVNGSGPYQFLLDTGANTTLVTPEFAQKLGLQFVDRIELVTVAGTQVIPRARVQNLSLGSKTVTDLEILVSNLHAVRSVSPTICGVLGQNFLTQFNYLVDYRNCRIEFEDDTELEYKFCGLQLPIELHEGRTLVPLKNHWRLVLDSGISMLSFFDAATRMKDLEFTASQLRPMNAASDLGSRIVWQGYLQSFVIGQESFQKLPVALFEIKAAAEGRVEDGLLPMCLFDSIYLNHQKKYLLLNPRPTHPSRKIPPKVVNND